MSHCLHIHYNTGEPSPVFDWSSTNKALKAIEIKQIEIIVQSSLYHHTVLVINIEKKSNTPAIIISILVIFLIFLINIPTSDKTTINIQTLNTQKSIIKQRKNNFS